MLEKNTGIAQPILDYKKKKNPTVDYLECYCFRLRHERWRNETDSAERIIVEHTDSNPF